MEKKNLKLFNPEVVQATENWLKAFVIELNLCPFAKAEWVKKRIRFSVLQSTEENELLAGLKSEFELLDSQSEIETSLLIHPNCLEDFYDYNQFLTRAENLLSVLGYTGVYQLASFHPQYQFAGTHPQDIENYTNRAPYPMLHILRESSLDRVLKNYPQPELSPERNIEVLRDMGLAKIKTVLKP